MARLPNEDPDVWRLCDAVERLYGISITYIGLNLTPWDIFYQEGMMGNSRVDPCSRRLKREVLKTWLEQNCDPADTLMHVGITEGEIERMIAIRANWTKQGWNVNAPLETFNVSRADQLQECELVFGFIPRLYRYGFTHNNCGGACVKAGLREWARLLWYIPDVYDWWEQNERQFREQTGKDVSILKDRRIGANRVLTLEAFRERCQRWWRGCLPGFPFELLPRVKELDPTPGCVFCEAA
jgi:hypothetical protein